jgi:DNA adenine methylase
MNPLIKWPGGKSGEYKYIKSLIPKFDRYVEPFFGGGAIYFKLEPSSAVINDINLDLTNFYKSIQRGDKSFFELLYFFAEEWKEISKLVDSKEKSIIELFNKVDSSEQEVYNLLFASYKFSEHYMDNANLKHQIIKNLKSKIRRTKVITNESTTNKDIVYNIEAAVKSGVYMHFRDVYNKKLGVLSSDEKAAVFFFIREFCYASMFRYNKNGDFNIPYGGIGYNRKNFKSKIEYIASNAVAEQLKSTEILNVDFEELIRKAKNTDFIFLDPPYDTEFKDYDKNPFTSTDQERLADSLSSTKAKFILIIKQTEFISGLYKNRGFKVDSFEKTYLYNVRGRNDRQVNHLLIYNF